MLGQKHTDIIKIIKWGELDINWMEPPEPVPVVPERKKNILLKAIKIAIKIFTPYGIIKLWRMIKSARLDRRF
ncbi:MAG: hypothetical protein LBC53_09325 [Spirochaetaceae bacterium]|nr:hypothetical protein [Spirochaetaceae bacterium]